MQQRVKQQRVKHSAQTSPVCLANKVRQPQVVNSPVATWPDKLSATCCRSVALSLARWVGLAAALVLVVVLLQVLVLPIWVIWVVAKVFAQAVPFSAEAKLWYNLLTTWLRSLRST
jgi:hypothetical protein